jgi:hypothetical protein
MRELKFRQALMSFGKFCGWHYWGFIDGKFVSPAESAECSVANAEKHSYQFIERKDKNDKEIYVGNIVRLKWQGHVWGIYTVEFGEGANEGGGDSSSYFYGYYLKEVNSGKQHADYLIKDDLTIEIIGNTIENPELLKEAEE